MATQPFKVNFSDITSRVIMVWYKHTNPLAEVGRLVLPFPNISGEVVQAHGLLPESYLFRFYESADGATLDLLIESWSIDVAKGIKTSIRKFFYVVGGPGDYDPAPNTTTLTDPRLQGADEMYIHNRALGFRRPEDFTINEDGFTLLNGELFSEFDEWMVEVVYKDDAGFTPVPESSTDMRIFSANEAFSDDHKGANNVAAFPADTTGIVTFPAFSGIADCTATYSTFSNAGRYLRLQFASGNTVVFEGEIVNQITLRKSEKVTLQFKSGVCYVTDYRGNAHLAGEYLFAGKKLMNTEYADGREANIADYQDLIDRLPAAKIVSYADWDLWIDIKVGIIERRYYRNRGKFAVDATAGTFKFPDLRGFSFRALRVVDGTEDITMLSQGAGGMWHQELIQHNHGIKTTFSQPSGNNSGDPVRGSINGSENDRGGEGSDKTISVEGGLEQRVDSIGLLPLVRI